MIPDQVGGCLGGTTVLSNGSTVRQTVAGDGVSADNLPEFTDNTTVLGPDGCNRGQMTALRLRLASQVAACSSQRPTSTIVGCVIALINSEGITHPVTGLFPLPTNTSC